ncbi:MAG: (2Fe-2S)-binding protein [Myxococcales bacterium]|nr:(2Fe-2S)-binding protein [Myxococcales bacterium]
MPKVRFLPSDVVLEGGAGQSIFEIAWKSDVGIQSACVGKGICGLCRVVIVSGEEGLSPYCDVEEKHLGNLYHLTRLRLSCQAIIIGECEGDITVEVKPRKSRKKR